MANEVEFIERLYERFNARDIEALLSSMSEDVVWGNGMEGGHVHGREGVREYWTRQWAMIDPRVDPTNIFVASDGEIAVEVQQVVHDLNGQLLARRTVVHVFLLEGGLITRFDIRSEQFRHLR